MEIELSINGRLKRFEVEPNTLLVNLLRDNLHLTGTKYGCGIGECSACTVHLNGESILSCLTLAVDVDEKRVDTIEGISVRSNLDPIQEAFLEEGAVQCGFCTPGFVMITRDLLNKNPDPSESEIREYLKGNLCRCTGYVNIVKAVKNAAEKMKKER